jgi:hypothetical protein
MSQIMHDLGFPKDLIGALQALYDGQTTCIITPHGDTEDFLLERGTVQGDPLSPFMFLIMIDPLLRWLQKGGRGYVTHASQTGDLQSYLECPTYADDMLLMAETIADMQRQVYKVAEYEAWTGMSLSLSKCVITGVFYPSDTRCFTKHGDEVFTVKGLLACR